ncbi:hypothetical protein ACFQNE_16465 [Gordonia phosphorivorans]|uniref:Secreted protein n=1 Tax=Gordonia phosphorivorans TaxID=1056982 RepID=A0ABV6HBV3_9ACTN
MRRAGALAVAGAATAALAGLGAGSAQAAPGDNLPDNCLEFSSTGNNWITDADAAIDWTGNIPIPDIGTTVNEVLNGSVKIRNVCDEPAKFQVYAGNWSVSGNGSAYVRADLGTQIGVRKNLAPAGNFGIEVAAKNVTKNVPMEVKLFLGIPAGETAQGFTINPGWSFSLEEVAPGGGNGGGDCESGSLAGVDLFGSLGQKCGDTGSLGSGSSVSKQLIDLNSPAITTR